MRVKRTKLEKRRIKNAETLKDLREASGLSQRDVANKLKLTSAQSLSNWERGVACVPAAYISKLSRLYKSDPMLIKQVVINWRVAGLG